MPHSQPEGLFHGRLAPNKTAKINAPAWLLTSHAHSHPFGALHGRLAPYKTAKINAPASKLAERYFYCFAWLVA